MTGPRALGPGFLESAGGWATWATSFVAQRLPKGAAEPTRPCLAGDRLAESHRAARKSSQRRGRVLLMWLRIRASGASPEDLPGIPLRQDWVLNPELRGDS